MHFNLIKIGFFIVTLLISGCDTMMHKEIYIPHSMETGSSLSRVVTVPKIAASLDMIEEAALTNGLYKVQPKNGAYRRYDSEKNPSEKRGSFTYMDIFVIPASNQIKIEYFSFPASPFGDVELLKDIERNIAGTNN